MQSQVTVKVTLKSVVFKRGYKLLTTPKGKDSVTFYKKRSFTVKKLGL